MCQVYTLGGKKIREYVEVVRLRWRWVRLMLMYSRLLANQFRHDDDVSNKMFRDYLPPCRFCSPIMSRGGCSAQQFPSAAMVYNEVVLNWVKAMHFVSSSNRVMAKLNFLGGDKKASSEERLVAEIEALERQVGAVGVLIAPSVLCLRR